MNIPEVIVDQARLEAIVPEMLDQPTYAVDTEFHRERTYYPRVALVQINWGTGMALIDPLAVSLEPLAAVLDGPGLAVMHASSQDLEVMTRACGTLPGRLFDTQIAAGFTGLRSPSLAALHDKLLGIRLPKGDRLTDWLRRPLTETQLEYAASDVSHLLEIHRLLDETVRRERGWLISSLVARLGPAQVDLAQDVAQDAIVKALSTWPYKGVPDNPRAWLRRVAGNAAIDRMRRSARELGLEDSWDFTAPDEDIITPSLSDPELDLMVLCCDPQLAPQDQLVLALKTVCGFTAAETGSLLFLKEDTLAQRLARAKRQLRSLSGDLARYPTRFALKQRLPLMLRIIYLIFAWGYLPRRGKSLIREDLCREALRLSEGLMAHAPETAPGHHALHALLLPVRSHPYGQANPRPSLQAAIHGSSL